MSISYIGVCRTCKKKLDLQNFYIDGYLKGSHPWSQDDDYFMGVTELGKKTELWGPWMARWVGFSLRHPGHLLEIINETKDEDEAWDFEEELPFTKHCLEPFVHPKKRECK